MDAGRISPIHVTDKRITDIELKDGAAGLSKNERIEMGKLLQSKEITNKQDINYMEKLIQEYDEAAAKSEEIISDKELSELEADLDYSNYKNFKIVADTDKAYFDKLGKFVRTIEENPENKVDSNLKNSVLAAAEVCNESMDLCKKVADAEEKLKGGQLTTATFKKLLEHVLKNLEVNEKRIEAAKSDFEPGMDKLREQHREEAAKVDREYANDSVVVKPEDSVL